MQINHGGWRFMIQARKPRSLQNQRLTEIDQEEAATAMDQARQKISSTTTMNKQ